MGGRGGLVPVGGEGLSGSAESKVWPRPAHRHPAGRPGQPEGGALLPQEESRRGEIPAEVEATSDAIDRLLVKLITLQVVKCSPVGSPSCKNVSVLHLDMTDIPQSCDTFSNTPERGWRETGSEAVYVWLFRPEGFSVWNMTTLSLLTRPLSL